MSAERHCNSCLTLAEGFIARWELKATLITEKLDFSNRTENGIDCLRVYIKNIYIYIKNSSDSIQLTHPFPKEKGSCLSL